MYRNCPRPRSHQCIVGSIKQVLKQKWRPNRALIGSQRCHNRRRDCILLLVFQYLVTWHLSRVAAFVRRIDPGAPRGEQLQLDRPATGRWRPDILNAVMTSINGLSRSLHGAHAELRQSDERLRVLTRETTAFTGIALTLTKQLAELVGARLGVDSREGVASVFWVDLPCADADAYAPAARDAAPAQRQINSVALDVLYVEDNPSNVAVMSAFLDQHPNVRLRTAGDGASGLVQARERRPDVVLLDIHLPGMGGYEVLRQLRADPKLQSVHVVALSADAMPHDVQRGRAAGFDH
jgi:CheY-like chemotaxis protein